jgi:protein-S-isoprenylcysteine O-methyltransferase Ste14
MAIYLIAYLPDRTIWAAPMWLTWIMRSIQSAGFVLGIRAFEYMDTREFMGFRQVWQYLRTGETGGDIEGLTRKELVSTGVYGMVRHPMYAAGLLIFTFSPRITENGLTITVLADLYFLFGMFIEERRFVKIFGEQYREYQKQVPMMVPRVFSWQGRERKEG